MVIYAIKPKFQQFLKPLERQFVRWKIHPTTINIAALVLSVIGGLVLYLAGSNKWLLLYIPVMAFVRTALNALDGMVARDLKVKNQEWGEVLNETLDRISDAAIFMGLALAPYSNLALGATATILVLISSYLAIVNKAAGGSRIYLGLMTKADRMILLGLMAVVILVSNNYTMANIFFFILGLTMIVTIVQRFSIVYQELHE